MSNKNIFLVSAFCSLLCLSTHAQTLESIMASAPKLPSALALAQGPDNPSYNKWSDEVSAYNDMEWTYEIGESELADTKAQLTREAKARQSEVNAIKGKSADQIMMQMGGISMADIEAMSHMTEDEMLDYVMMNGLDRSGKAAMNRNRNSQLGKDASSYNGVAKAYNKRADVHERMYTLQNKWNHRRDSLLTIGVKRYNSEFVPQLEAIDQQIKSYWVKDASHVEGGYSSDYKAVDKLNEKKNQVEDQAWATCFYEYLIEEIGFEQQALQYLFADACSADRAAAESGSTEQKISAKMRPSATAVVVLYRQVSTTIPDFGQYIEQTDDNKNSIRITHKFAEVEFVAPNAPRIPTY